MNRIVVGTDRSEASVHAARWALDLARRTHASVKLVEAFRSPSVETSPADLETQVGDHVDLLESWARTNLLSPVSVAAIAGPPVPVLVAQCLESNVDALVIGTTGTSGVTHWALGGAIHGLAHELAKPLIIVPPGLDALGEGPIVVGVDGSEGSEIALEWCERLGAAIDRDVIAFYSVPGIYGTFDAAGNFGEEEKEATAEAHDGRRRTRFEELVGGDAVGGLRAEAIERDATALVVAARDRHSFHGLLLGTVVDQLIHEPRQLTVVIPHAYCDLHRPGRNDVDNPTGPIIV